MEIIHLILGKANPERMNGVNKVVHEMATNQVLSGYHVQVWGIAANLVHDYPERVFQTRLFKAQPIPFKCPPELKTRLLDYKGRIIVHLHGAFLPVFYTVSKFLHSHQIPFIITPHSTYNKVMMQKNPLRKKIYFGLFERHLLDRAAAIHLLGRSEWEGLAHIYHNRKSFMMPYGFSPGKDRTPVKKMPLFSVAYCGRLSIYPKGLDILLQGFALFNRQNPHSQLIMIGDGKDKTKLMELSLSLGLESSVVFRGSLFGDEKIKALQQCHVFAHPSRTDGLPATIIEASALGIPCVISEATNMGEFIDRHDAGYTMEKIDKEECSNGLQLLYDRIVGNGEGALLQFNSLKMIDQEFNWTKILRKFEFIYKNSEIENLPSVA